MSDHGHAGGGSHADHHHEYLGEPADEAGPGEPATPGWLTLLGIGLVLTVMLGFLATRSDGKTRAELSGSTSASAAPAAAPKPPTPAPEAAARPAAQDGRPPGLAGALGRPTPGEMPRVRPGAFAVGSGAPPRPRAPE